ERLRASMRDSEHSLRRLHFAMQFGLKLDLDAIEREIERRTALSGGKSSDAAWARFSLAFAQKTPREVADYIDRHRTQLEAHIGRQPVCSFEIEMLVRAGLLERAEERRLALAREGLPEAQQERLRRIIADATQSDPIEVRKARFEASGQFVDLVTLVTALE